MSAAVARPLFAIYGASGCGRGVLPIAAEMLTCEIENGAELIFVDDAPPGKVVNGRRVLTFGEFLAEPAAAKHVSIAIANPRIRGMLAERCHQHGIRDFSIKSASTIMMDEVQVGEGAILSPFTTLTSNVRIGRHFHCNLYSYVEHDCVIGDFVTFAPGVHCNGNVHIHDYAYLGSGCLVKQGSPRKPLVIGEGATVGMGAVVTKDVAPGTTVVGNPARAIERRLL